MCWRSFGLCHMLGKDWLQNTAHMHKQRGWGEREGAYLQ